MERHALPVRWAVRPMLLRPNWHRCGHQSEPGFSGLLPRTVSRQVRRGRHASGRPAPDHSARWSHQRRGSTAGLRERTPHQEGDRSRLPERRRGQQRGGESDRWLRDPAQRRPRQTRSNPPVWMTTRYCRRVESSSPSSHRRRPSPRQPRPGRPPAQEASSRRSAAGIARQLSEVSSAMRAVARDPRTARPSLSNGSTLVLCRPEAGTRLPHMPTSRLANRAGPVAAAANRP